MLQRAGEEDDQALDDDDHVARDRRHVEGELGAALVEHAEEERREHDADRMRAAHQRHRDADEAGALHELDLQPLLVAHDRVQRHHAGERAGDQHGDDGDAVDRDAGIDRRGRVEADGADLVAEPRAPDQHVDEDRRGERQEEADVERRAAEIGAEQREQPVELRQRAAGAEGARLRRHRARLRESSWRAGTPSATRR